MSSDIFQRLNPRSIPPVATIINDKMEPLVGTFERSEKAWKMSSDIFHRLNPGFNHTSGDLFKEKLEPLVGIEPTTYSLPRSRYTAKPQWQPVWGRFIYGLLLKVY